MNREKSKEKINLNQDNDLKSLQQEILIAN